MTTLRLATRDDLPALLDMARAFHAASEHRHVPFCPESTAATADALFKMGFALVAEADGVPVGMIGVAISPVLFNVRHTIALEAMWWVEPEWRKSGAAAALIAAAEREAKKRGAARIQMLALSNSPKHVARLYARRGYYLSETAYIKDL